MAGESGSLTMTSAGAFSLGVPVRVYDFALGTTAAASSSLLWNLSASGDTTGMFPVLTVKAGGYVTSSKGWRFPNGLWMNLVGAGTASINYITEF